MRFVHITHDTPLSGFNRPASSLQLGSHTLKQWVQNSARALRWHVDEQSAFEALIEGPAIVARDDVYLSPRAFRSLKKEIQTRKSENKPLRLLMPSSRLLELTLPLQEVLTSKNGTLFDVAFIPAGQKKSAAELFALTENSALKLPFKELLVDVDQPRYILQQEASSLSFPFSTTLVMQIRHWVHALRLSHLFPQVLLLEKALSQPIRSSLRAFFSLRNSKSKTIFQLKRNFSYRGKNVEIHPSAVVEASIIGDNVRIGPHASVIGSIIANDVIIEDRVHVFQSVLGPHSFLSRNSSMSACLIMGNTDACANGIQACVVDEEVGLTSFARPLDLNLNGPVKVQDNGQFCSVGELPCGVFFARGSFIGGGVTIGAGRVVPPGISLVAGGDALFTKFPDASQRESANSTTWTLAAGKLTPLSLKKP